MRISCPICGERTSHEFVYGGDATRHRPPLPESAADMHDYIYVRDNPAGLHREYWFHAAGCQEWLVVTRNTLTHEKIAVEIAAAPDTAGVPR